MKKLRPVRNKSYAEIASEWDEFANIRSSQIEAGIDLSYDLILTPCIFSLSSESDYTKVLDIGCGAGHLTFKLSEQAENIVGVDLSKESIEIACKKYGFRKNIKFIHSSIEDYSNSVEQPQFSLAIANMTLMDVINLDDVLSSISKLLKRGGQFVFTITHPCYWPFYWGYSEEKWFDYKKEIAIEATFNISLQDTNGYITTHVHRPLEMYLNTLVHNGFKIDTTLEPMPDSENIKKYPKEWEYPRFLAVKCIKE